MHTVPAEIVQGQIEAVMEDLRPDALKIGMVSEPALVKIIAGCLLKYPHCPIVYDPVMVSTSGRKLMAKDAIQLIKEELFPLTSLITPNLDETEVLTGKKITTAEEMKEAARQLSEEYHTAVLVKGGHLEGNEMQDVLFTDGNAYIYKEKKIESPEFAWDGMHPFFFDRHLSGIRTSYGPGSWQGKELCKQSY